MKSLKKIIHNSVFSLLAILGIFLGFFLIMLLIVAINGPETDTKLLVKEWSSTLVIFIFSALTCIWSNMMNLTFLKLLNPNISNSPVEGFLKKFKVWIIASVGGVVIMLLLQGVAILVFLWTQNLWITMVLGFCATITGFLFSEIYVVLKLFSKFSPVSETDNLLTDYQKYLKEVEDILYAERAIIDSVDFKLVSEYVLKLIKSDPVGFEKSIKTDRPLQNLIYSIMANRLADLIETGRYHVYRGILSSSGIDMLARYDRYVDKNVSLGDLNEDEAKRIKQSLRNEINKMG